MRMFQLYRQEDETGVSGTGVVAEGVQFSDGTCALRWCSALKSTGFYASIQTIKAIHGHNGKTVVLWVE